MNMKKYYSLRDLSQELDIPKSTIVKYKDLYPEFFTLTGEGKRKKFTSQAVEVLGLIRRMREDEKLDWLEIRENLAGKYSGGIEPAAAEEETLAVAAVSPGQPPQGVSRRLDHLAHLFNSLALEVMRIGDQTRSLQGQQRIHAEQLVRLAGGVAKLHHDIEIVLIESMNRDESNRQFIAAQVSDIKGQFASIQRNIKALAIAIKNSGSAQGQAEMLAPLMAKIDRIAEMSSSHSESDAVSSAKLSQLQRENELLKEKIRQLGAMRRETAEVPPASLKKGGLLNKMFKSRP